MSRAPIVAMALVAAAIAGDGAGRVQPPAPSVLLASNARARAALARAVAAHGGEAALRGITTISLDERGQAFMRAQGPYPGRPLAARPSRTVVMLDLAGGRGCVAPDPFTHSDTDRVEDMWYVWHPRTVLRDGAVHQLDMRTRTRAAPRAGSLRDLVSQQRSLPTTWLLEALAAPHGLRWIGEEGEGVARSSLVGLTTSDARAVTLRIGADGLLRSVERLTTDPAEGDAVASTEFSEYRRLAGLVLPGRRINRIGSDVVLDVHVQQKINEGIDESCLVVPEDFSVRPAARPATPGAVDLGHGVFLLQALGDAYNALAVLFSDHVLVVEAPEHETPSGLSAQAMRLVEGIAGGRPIRYLAFTHFHTDHAGGVRDYIAEGATILTTARTVPWVEQVARARFALQPDRLARAPRAAKVRTIADRFVLEDATQRVEFHMVPWDHAAEELIVYVPRAGLVFDGDLFASGQGDAPVAQRIAERLEATIGERGLQVRTLVGVHGRPRPFAELGAAIERRRQLLAATGKVSRVSEAARPQPRDRRPESPA
jgi:glyoxylase-like metal-dependent hydrolase (beta-lactamase superfamily II)